MIQSYCVVQEVKLDCFEAEVNRLIREGWEPIGGVAVTTENKYSTDHGTYSQALVKKEG